MLRRDYIFPREKRFPVYDVEHERRAWAYVQAGRLSFEQLLPVVVYLADEARDPTVRAEAKKAWQDWEGKGTGQVLKTINIIGGRIKKLRKNPAETLRIQVWMFDGELGITPSARGNVDHYRRELIMAAVRERRGEDRATIFHDILDCGPTVAIDDSAGIEAFASGLGLTDEKRQRLADGEELTVSVPQQTFVGLLKQAYRLRNL